MTASSTKPSQDVIAQYQEAVANLEIAAKAVVAEGKVMSVPLESISAPLYASAQLFTAVTDIDIHTNWVVTEDELTATQTAVLVNALLKAVDLNYFDLAMWCRREN